MKPFSFVHAADLHLGSPFTGLAECNPKWAERLAQATFQAFERIIRLCLERQVDFLLLAGDVYDSSEQDLRAQVCVRDGLARLSKAGISTYIATGNHDYTADGIRLQWPTGVYFFPPGQVATYQVVKDNQPVAIISGVSYPSQNPTQNYVPLFSNGEEALFAIGVLHTNVGKVADYGNYAPCSLTDLQSTGIDYWALGHVHRAQVLNSDHPTIIYPGTSQGRSSRETGPKGCYYVQVSSAGVEPTFVPTAEVLWAELKLDISGWEQVDQIFTAVEDGLAEYARQADYLVVKLSLIGTGQVHDELAIDGAREQLTEALRVRTYTNWRGVWFDQVKIETRSPSVRTVEQGTGTLAADFMEVIDLLATEITANQDSPLVRELLAEVSPILAKYRRYLPPCTPDGLLTSVSAAGDLGLDLLIRQED